QVGTIPRFRGPDKVTEMWADAGGGARYLMVATSLGAMVDDQESRLGDLENIVANLQALTQSVVLSVVYDEGPATWPPRPARAGRAARPVRCAGGGQRVPPDPDTGKGGGGAGGGSGSGVRTGSATDPPNQAAFEAANLQMGPWTAHRGFSAGGFPAGGFAATTC